MRKKIPPNFGETTNKSTFYGHNNVFHVQHSIETVSQSHFIEFSQKTNHFYDLWEAFGGIFLRNFVLVGSPPLPMVANKGQLWLRVRVCRSNHHVYDLNGSITSACFMFIGSVCACLCSMFQLFDGVGVSTVFYIISHVCLIIFLYNSRYMSFVSNCGVNVRGRIISTGALIQMACPFLLTLSSRLLEEVFENDYDRLSKLFLGLSLVGAVFPVLIIVFRLKNR